MSESIQYIGMSCSVCRYGRQHETLNTFYCTNKHCSRSRCDYEPEAYNCQFGIPRESALRVKPNPLNLSDTVYSIGDLVKVKYENRAGEEYEFIARVTAAQVNPDNAVIYRVRWSITTPSKELWVDSDRITDKIDDEAQQTALFSSPQKKLDLEFVSYDGAYPTLCDGRLTLRDKATNTFYRLDGVLQSGGKCMYMGADEGCEVTVGPWVVCDEHLPYELLPYVDEITRLVNENVEYGCCGGCS